MPIGSKGEEEKRNRKVCVLAYDSLRTFEYAMVVEVFVKDRPKNNPWYTFSIVNANSNEVTGLGNVTVRPEHGLPEFVGADLIIIPGWTSRNTPVSGALKSAIMGAHANGCRIAASCSGIFVLAQCGLLDGRSATTHWRYIKTLAEKFPAINIDPDVLYVDEGDVLTSAGSVSGIDLFLHIVRQDFGAERADEVAKRLLMPRHRNGDLRDGGQRHYMARHIGDEYKGNIAVLLDVIRENLDQDWNITRMAEQSKTSTRTLQRRIRNMTGLSPHSWLTMERIELVKYLLETTNLNIQKIAEIAGLKTPETLRHHFKRITGTSPTQFRANFNPDGRIGR